MAETVEVRIPLTLYRRIQQLLEGTGFSSVDQFIVYVLRDAVARMEEERLASSEVSEEEKKRIIERLRSLGYL